MTWDDARAEFFRRQAAKGDPLLVHLRCGPAAPDSDAFECVPRRWALGKALEEIGYTVAQARGLD